MPELYGCSQATSIFGLSEESGGVFKCVITPSGNKPLTLRVNWIIQESARRKRGRLLGRLIHVGLTAKTDEGEMEKNDNEELAGELKLENISVSEQQKDLILKPGKLATGLLFVAGQRLSQGVSRLLILPYFIGPSLNAKEIETLATAYGVITGICGVVLFIVGFAVIKILINKFVVTPSIKIWRWISFLYLIGVHIIVVAITGE